MHCQRTCPLYQSIVRRRRTRQHPASSHSPQPTLPPALLTGTALHPPTIHHIPLLQLLSANNRRLSAPPRPHILNTLPISAHPAQRIAPHRPSPAQRQPLDEPLPLINQAPPSRPSQTLPPQLLPDPVRPAPLPRSHPGSAASS
ncbi:uncharacterized protein BKA78DRAFT_53903 [Phyllosticta capitalensis]|uniref:uncharacterized protein n=1 Tax=Phyllosticta capitalensis TaxID=121624 RepID=UPI003130A7C8